MHHLSHVRTALAALLTATVALGSLAATPVLATDLGDGLRAAANDWRTCANDGGSIDCHPVDPIGGTSLLDDIADARADQMRDADDLEHDMAYVRDRLERADVCWTKFGEIIAWRSGGPYSYEATALQWWRSDTHREIMTDADYNAAGGSWATADDGGHYSVMIFVRLCSSTFSESSTLEPTREYSPDRAMRLISGERAAYKFDANGKIVDRRTFRFDQGRNETATGRARVGGRAYLMLSSGRMEGWWVRESWRQYVRGVTQNRSYDGKWVRVREGTYRGLRFDSFGSVTASVKVSLGSEKRFAIGARAIINGRPYVKVTSGPLDGYWLRHNGDVRLVR
jgi:uncharacterized protein YkwD